MKCSACGNTIVPQVLSPGLTLPGYAKDDQDRVHCYPCCANLDKAWMAEHDRISLYISKDGEGNWTVRNWPGSLVIKPARIKHSTMNCFGWKVPRVDVWFRGPEGRNWHGFNAGHSNTILHCQKLGKDPVRS